MKLIKVHLRVQMVILTMVSATPGLAGQSVQAVLSQQDLQAKLAYCKTCHGLAGQGYRGASPIPRLAGQQPEYLENQLRAFIERRRNGSFMPKVVSGLSPTMIKAVAEHFRDLNPKPVMSAPGELAAIGKKLYEEGMPATGIQPCATCHGSDAKGDGAHPRLAGQLPAYTFKTLVNWNKERGQDPERSDTSAVMGPIAHSLTEERISAIAAYLGNLE
jgi:cytochrome c553